ncbi:MAG: hypothetical protein NTZ87_01245 [Candidatus Nomurabacteria bacterium]|nr:hypothetical protein [Candidatus Nomurabacteria bacterium]
MKNINLTNSKRPYRVSFIIINVFLSFFAGAILSVFLKGFINFGQTTSIIILLLIIIFWNIFSVYLSRRIWSDSESSMSQEIIYDENFKKKVEKYRNLIWTSFFILISPLIFFPLSKYEIFSDNAISIIVPILFYGGLFMLLSTLFYFSGVKNISANEFVKYPFQFINDPVLRKQAVEKRIKAETLLTVLIIAISLIMNYFGLLSMNSVIFAVVIVLFTIPYRYSQLRSVNS